MTRRPPTTARRAALGLTALGLAATLAACSGSHDAGTHGAAASSGSSGASAAGGSHDMAMGATPTYPAIVPGPAATGAHNGTDEQFATDMIPHHGQAVVMADLLLARGSDPEVRALAGKIKAAQSPEIVAMAGWLKGWGVPVPEAYGHDGDMAGMHHTGMMSEAQMRQLTGAMGVAADKAFVSLMIEHHQGAVDMARAELAQGSNADAKKLAQAIVTSQTAEIAQMRSILARLG